MNLLGLSRRITLCVGAFGLVVGCAGKSRGAPTTPSAAIAVSSSAPASIDSSPDTTAWLVSDSAGQTVRLRLEVTRPKGTPSAVLNGHRSGKARIVVPRGWTITWHWHNADPGSRHSLVVMAEREKVPLEGGRPAFPNAMTRSVVDGLPAGQTDQTTFVADEAGWYWVLCGVPSHALNGEWLELRVDPEASGAVVRIRNGER